MANSISSSSTSEMQTDLFSRLPPDLRMKIFAYGDLVITDFRGRKTGLHIYKDEFYNPHVHYKEDHSERYCTCEAPFLDTFLRNVSDPFYGEIIQVAFSKNRLICGGEPGEILAFFKTHVQALGHINDLKIQFDADNIDEISGTWRKRGPDEASFEQDWETLVGFMRQHLNLPNLILCINAMVCIPEYHLTGDADELHKDCDIRLRAYKRIIEPLRGLGAGENGLKRFYVFWAMFHWHEAVAEREVMGPWYRAPYKVPSHRRHNVYDPRSTVGGGDREWYEQEESEPGTDEEDEGDDEEDDGDEEMEDDDEDLDETEDEDVDEEMEDDDEDMEETEDEDEDEEMEDGEGEED